jgi:hypothetical protein
MGVGLAMAEGAVILGVLVFMVVGATGAAGSMGAGLKSCAVAADGAAVDGAVIGRASSDWSGVAEEAEVGRTSSPPAPGLWLAGGRGVCVSSAGPGSSGLGVPCGWAARVSGLASPG